MTDKERLDEIKNNYSVGIHILSGKPSVAIPKENFEWLINRVEELEKENRELNMEIGTYSSKIDEIQRSIGVKIADLKILSTQMLKGDSKMSERLENMSPIGFDLNGNLLLKSEDYHWLMEQAEQVEKLEKEKEEWKDTTQSYYKTAQSYYNTIQELREQNKRYKQALKEIAVYCDTAPFNHIAKQALEGDK